VRSAFVVVAALIAASAAHAAPGGWLSYANGHERTSSVADPALSAASTGLRRFWTTKLGGRIIASPLAADLPAAGLTIFAATESGNVYALDVAGNVLWRAALGSVDTYGGCGTYGVSSTGVVDLQRGVLYVANADGYVHALRLADGDEAPGWPVQVTDRPRTEYVWGGLTLVDSRLYVPIASYCDVPDELGIPGEGRLLGVDVDRPAAAPISFDPVPGADNLGGIWGWGGVAVAPDGRSLYFGVGNAEPDVDAGYSDSLVQVSTDLSRVLGASRPPGAIPGADIDLGAAPVLFHPEGCPALLAANDKDGTLVVWRQDNVAAGVYQRIVVSNGMFAFVGAPSWSARTQLLYDAGATALASGMPVVGTQALGIGPNCTIEKRWFVATGNGTQPQPLVAGDLVFITGGTKGGLYAVRADTGFPVWQHSTAGATWSPPIDAGGLVVVGDLAGDLYAFYPRVSTTLHSVR
jgi:outer membrane protein assembly factor BamB